MNKNVTALILIVLAAGVYFTYTQAQISKLQADAAVNSQYSAAIDNSLKLIKLRDKVLQQYNGISDEDKARLDKIVPDNVDNVRLIIDISGIAARHGLSTQGIKTSADAPAAPASGALPAAASAGPGLSTVTVSFTVTTNYQNFVSFLQDLERSLRILDVTHIALSASETGVYTYGVTLKTYWLRQ